MQSGHRLGMYLNHEFGKYALDLPARANHCLSGKGCVHFEGGADLFLFSHVSYMGGSIIVQRGLIAHIWIPAENVQWCVCSFSRSGMIY